jgi:hypothetical protein
MVTSSGNRLLISIISGCVSVGIGVGVAGSAVSGGPAAGVCVGGGIVSMPTSKVVQPAVKNRITIRKNNIAFLYSTSSSHHHLKNVVSSSGVTITSPCYKQVSLV